MIQSFGNGYPSECFLTVSLFRLTHVAADLKSCIKWTSSRLSSFCVGWLVFTCYVWCNSLCVKHMFVSTFEKNKNISTRYTFCSHHWNDWIMLEGVTQAQPAWIHSFSPTCKKICFQARRMRGHLQPPEEKHWTKTGGLLLLHLNHL